jgi:hypothetical protein
LGKPALIVWAAAGLKARQPYVRQITPRKVLHCKTSRYVMDDAQEHEIMESLNAIC